MIKKILIFASFYFSLAFLQSCASGWYTLQLDSKNQPIQFGPHQLGVMVDTLGIISGFATHEFEEETYSESEHTSIGFGPKDEITENLNTTIYSALKDDPQHFIADGEVVIEVEHGISFGAIFLGMVASWITDEEAEYGSYSIESISFNGVVYKIRKEQDKE